MSATPSELAPSEMPVSDVEDVGEATPAPKMPSFPPYPPYATEPAPPSVADTIIAGHDLRLQHKSIPRKPLRPPPKPARPRGPKATDVKMSQRAMRAHARCLRKHGAILTDRLERMSKPLRRNIIYMWREHAYTLPPETIARLRAMLDADEPFKPDQAYEYFINLKKTKKKAAATEQINEIKKDMLAMVGEKRFLWARNATVAFARGIQQRLSRPGRYSLADGMLRLSNIILDEICGYMHMRTPSRRSNHPKAKFMMEMADKVAVWIDEILSESDDRMLMMDFDEDDEVERFYEDEVRPEGEPHDKDRSPLDVTPGESGTIVPDLGATTEGVTPTSTATEPTTPQSEATPGEAATPATGGQTPQTEATPAPSPKPSGTEPPKPEAEKASSPEVKKEYWFAGLQQLYINNIINIPSYIYGRHKGDGGDGGDGDGKYTDDDGGAPGQLLSAPPAYTKFHGNMKEAFEILTDTMDSKGGEKLISHGKFQQTFGEGADTLKRAKDFKATNYNVRVSDRIRQKLTAATKEIIPDHLDKVMNVMVDICSKYLAQNAENNKKKGKAFKLLVSAMKNKKNEKLYKRGKVQRTYAQAAEELEKSESLDSEYDDPNLSQELYSAMSKAVKNLTPAEMQKEMAGIQKYLYYAYLNHAMYKEEVRKLKSDFRLKSAPGFSNARPDPATANMFKTALHKSVDAATPKNHTNEMKDIIDQSGNYLSAFARDRGPAMNALLGMMKTNPKNVFASRNEYTMDYDTAAEEIRNAPTIVPFLPVQDIADEGNAKLTKDMKDVTPPDLQIPMKVLINDASKHLSQAVAMRSGEPGDTYPMNFLAAVKKSLGTKPLYKYKSYGQSYADAGDTLENAGPIETTIPDVGSEMSVSTQPPLPSQSSVMSEEKPRKALKPGVKHEPSPAVELAHEIVAEMKRGVPTQLAPTVAEELKPTMEKAAMHLANHAVEKGDAMEYMVDLMKDKGEEKLGKLQGYDQTYTDGARRVENTPSLTNEKVDKSSYESVRRKLSDITKDKPNAKFAQQMPGIVADTAKFLSAPVPETDAEKRQVLGDLMAREGDKIIGEDGAYKMTYREGGEEIKNAPVGVTKAHDEKKNKEMVKKLEAVVPDKKMAAVLKESTKEGAAHLTDAVKGRGEAMKVIQESLKKEKNKEFIEVGDFNKTHEQIADMLTQAPNLKSENPSPVILEKVEHQLSVLPKDIPADKPLAKKHMEETTEIAAKYIATQATKESGLDNQQLAALDAAGFNADAKAAAEERRVAAVAAGPAGDKAAKAGATEEDEEEEDDGTGKKKKKRKPKTAGAGAAEDDRTKQKGTGDVSEAGAAGRTDAATGGGRSDAAAGGGRSDVAAVAAMGAGPRSAGPGGTTVGPDGTVYAPDGTVQKGPGGAVLSKDTAGKASEKDKSGAVVQRHGEVVQGPGGVVKGEGGLVKGPGGVIKDEGGLVKGPGGVAQGPEGSLVKGPGGVVQGPGGVAQGPEGGLVKGPGGVVQPGGVTQGPEGGLVKGPGGAVQGPGAVVQGPGGVVQGPGGVVQGPGGVVQGPGGVVQGPGGVIQGPGGVAQGPGGVIQGPGGVVQGPGGVVQGPGGVKQGPGGVIQGTGGVVQGPGGVVQGPGGVVKGPGGVVQGPGGVVQGPGGVVQGPGGVVQGPGGVVQGPGGVVQGPGGVVQSPGGVVQGPGGVVQGPGGVVQGPGGVVQGSSGVIQGPGGVVHGPDGVALGPDGVALGPGGVVQGPGGVAQGPGGVVLGPGGVVVGPGGGDQGPREVDQNLAGYIPSSSKAGSGHAPGAHGARGVPSAPGVTGLVPSGPGPKPAGVVYGPDGTAYGPDGTVYAPDGAVYATDGTVYLPDGTVYGPDGSVSVGQGPTGAEFGPGGALQEAVIDGQQQPGGVTRAQTAGAPIIGPDGKKVKVGGVASYGQKQPPAYPGGETEEQRRRRLEEAEAFRKYEEAEKLRLGEKEYFRQQVEKYKREQEAAGPGKYRGGALGADYDREHETALDILHCHLRAHGTEVFYAQPQATMTHGQASDWLRSPMPMKVDKAVKESGDTARLHKKFEKKLNGLVSEVTPPELYDCMQDVVIEAARRLSECFVSTSYNTIVNDALISEMQKRGNEILTEVDGAAETYFYASQRLKKAGSLDVEEPCYKVANDLNKKLDDVIRTRPMARKLNAKMRDHIRETANFLSGMVTKPDEKIEAYIALLEEMEAAGESVLIEGDIPKTYQESSEYLRQLTSFQDQIKRPNPTLQAETQKRLQDLMASVPPNEARYDQETMNEVIAEVATLLTSYVMLHAEKTDALKVLEEEIRKKGDAALLRHGPIRKSYKHGADLLRGKTTDQLAVPAADPVVVRKIQIKLHNLMNEKRKEYENNNMLALMDEVIEDATIYLAVYLLHPKVIQVCKCYKNVLVQCELWCDEILRRVARPSCTCSRHGVAQELRDAAPPSQDFGPGPKISFTTCPEQIPTSSLINPDSETACPAPTPTPECRAHGPTTSYLLYSTSRKLRYDSMRISSAGSSNSSHFTSSSSSPIQVAKQSSPLKNLFQDVHVDTNGSMQFVPQLPEEEAVQPYEAEQPNTLEVTPPSYFSSSNYCNFNTTQQQQQQPQQPASVSIPAQQKHSVVNLPSPEASETSKITQAKSGYSSRTPIISPDQMVDWHAMMVSLMWNLQAWRDWIQEIVNHSLAYQLNPITSEDVNNISDANTDTWSLFYRRICTESLQWRHYCIFSRQLTNRLHTRYRNKEIVSPTPVAVKTKTYIECQEEMLEIIDMFNRWTQWLTLVIKETDSMEWGSIDKNSLHQMRWNHLKKKIEGYSKDWIKYDMFLKVSWEQKYSTVIADYLPAWKKPGPVWVVSACGAVPSGAVAAGVFDGEVIWVARTTHRSKVLPAALYPSKHSCLVYAEGAAHRYTKYQVMCNAEVRWVAWRGGSIGGRAVRVAPGVHIGRVHYRGDHLLGAVHEPHYRCHVVIFGRPFAFNCYELLMLANDVEE
ncbi:uncharacterized protein LOC124646052 [Helicoverpa zea]|uniref:uncharacterized protein LOC124646052 n=1 Tax=Helicoverpa zea TaxID=7113 RepID=UPI001F59CDF3|nr:uncharacterized protein LOC124646052 [Helicoverpa zea]